MHFGAKTPPTANFFDDVEVVNPGRLSADAVADGDSFAGCSIDLGEIAGCARGVIAGAGVGAGVSLDTYSLYVEGIIFPVGENDRDDPGCLAGGGGVGFDSGGGGAIGAAAFATGGLGFAGGDGWAAGGVGFTIEGAGGVTV